MPIPERARPATLRYRYRPHGYANLTTTPHRSARASRDSKLFGLEFSAALASDIAAAAGLELHQCEERAFEGGEYKTRPLTDVRDCDVFVIASLNGDSLGSANDKLCRLLFFVGALKDAGAATVTACVPFLCYSRKDRKTHANDPVTTRYVAAVFEAVGLDRMIVVDVHNEAAFDNAFRCETVRIEGADIFSNVLRESVDPQRCVVASPDIGGIKRAQRLHDTLTAVFAHDIGFAFMEKRRIGGDVMGDVFVGDVRDRDVVIYDDMIVSGTTIARAARAAREAGARKIVVAATHAAFTDDAAQLFAQGGPDLVLVSDSIALDDTLVAAYGPALKICSSAGVIGEAIRNMLKR